MRTPCYPGDFVQLSLDMTQVGLWSILLDVTVDELDCMVENNHAVDTTSSGSKHETVRQFHLCVLLSGICLPILTPLCGNPGRLLLQTSLADREDVVLS